MICNKYKFWKFIVNLKLLWYKDTLRGGVIVRILNPNKLAISHIQIDTYSHGTFFDESYDDPDSGIELKFDSDIANELLDGANNVTIDTQTDNFYTSFECTDMNGKLDWTYHYYTINLDLLTPTN